MSPVIETMRVTSLYSIGTQLIMAVFVRLCLRAVKRSMRAAVEGRGEGLAGVGFFVAGDLLSKRRFDSNAVGHGVQGRAVRGEAKAHRLKPACGQAGLCRFVRHNSFSRSSEFKPASRRMLLRILGWRVFEA